MFTRKELERIREISFDLLDFDNMLKTSNLSEVNREYYETEQALLNDELKKILGDK